MKANTDKPKILVADDNRYGRMVFGEAINLCGLEMIEANDGSECLQMVKEQRPDLILMDLQMPVMDGYTTIKSLKNNPDTKDIPIIAVTSFATHGDREKATEAGADDYISKPIDIKQLIAKMIKFVKMDDGESI